MNEAPHITASQTNVYFKEGITESIALQNVTAGTRFTPCKTSIQTNNPTLFRSLTANNNQINHACSNAK
jgi:hypothetical protein